MREEENESEEGAVEDDYGPGEIGGFGEVSGEIGSEISGEIGSFSKIGSFSEIGKREEPRSREKR